jgi:hypothetical protein
MANSHHLSGVVDALCVSGHRFWFFSMSMVRRAGIQWFVVQEEAAKPVPQLGLERSPARVAFDDPSLLTLGQPSAGGVGGVFGPCIEGDGRSRSSFMDCVGDGFEHRKAPGRQPDARSDNNAGIGRRSQLTLDRLAGCMVGADEADIGLPPSPRHLFQPMTAHRLSRKRRPSPLLK